MWEVPNANVRIGSLVKVSLSDAPEFSGRVVQIQEDDKFGAAFLIVRNSRSPIWVGEARITSVMND